MKEQLTSNAKAIREIDAFILDAVGKEIRTNCTTLKVDADTYERCFKKVFGVKEKPYRTRVTEIEDGDTEDCITLSYMGNNDRYDLRILKTEATAAAA